MKRIKIVVAFAFLVLFGTGVFSNIQARELQFLEPGGAGTLKCYDSWDEPSWFRDDYNARRCQPCDYIRGHDFGDSAFCVFTPT